jgi:cell division septum initiation protein DivIVA
MKRFAILAALILTSVIAQSKTAASQYEAAIIPVIKAAGEMWAANNEKQKVQRWQDSVDTKLDALLAQNAQILQQLKDLKKFVADVAENQSRITEMTHTKSLILTLSSDIKGRRSERRATILNDINNLQPAVYNVIAYYPTNNDKVVFARPVQQAAFAGVVAILSGFAVAPDNGLRKEILSKNINAMKQWDDEKRPGTAKYAISVLESATQTLREQILANAGKRSFGSYRGEVLIKSKSQGDFYVGCTSEVFGDVAVDNQTLAVTVTKVRLEGGDCRPRTPNEANYVPPYKAQIEASVAAYQSQMRELSDLKATQAELVTIVDFLSKQL